MLLPQDFPKNPHFTLDLSQALAGLEQAYAHLDAVVLTSKDPFLSEYVPLENSLRYGATGFTGSVGDAVYFTARYRETHPKQKPVMLVVDGRYHLQAEQETDALQVELVKLDVEPNIEAALFDRLAQMKGCKVGIDFERTSVASLARIETIAQSSGFQIEGLQGPAVLKALGLPGWTVNRPIFSLPVSATGRVVGDLLDQLNKAMHERSKESGNLHLTVAADDAAFLLNARGYHLPNAASFLAYTLLIDDEIILYLNASAQDCAVNLDLETLKQYKLTVVRNSLDELKAVLKKHEVKHVFFNGASANGLLPTLTKELFPSATVFSDFNWIVKTRVKKTNEEMASIRKAYIHSSRAIAKTLKFGKSESQKRNFSETELASCLYANFAEEEAQALSFKTISGAGAHSAIVHYSTPSASAYFKKGDLALLDCGAYYRDGFCTDTTRGFFVGSKDGPSQPEAWQTKIYTTTLKAGIKVFLAPIESALSGKEVDALIRDDIKKAGYDYMHGTGHGVGIHVHEDGIRFSTLSQYPQTAHACVSVEPGIYLKDKGGVRIENIAILHPEGPSRLRYENVVFVGYDWDLIDISQLTDPEKAYLKDYEAQCALLGTHLMECPL